MSESALITVFIVFFDSTAKGRIAKKEFGSYPTTNIYRCQANAWMDKAVMLDWMDDVRRPFSVCCDGAGPRCVPPHPRQLSMSHDGLGCPADPRTPSYQFQFTWKQMNQLQ